MLDKSRSMIHQAHANHLRGIMNIQEIYLPTDRYALEVALITKILRRPALADRYDRIHVALRAAGIEMGDIVMRDGYVRPTVREGLVDALVNLEPDHFTGEYEEDQVRWVLGEEGSVWPHNIKDYAT